MVELLDDAEDTTNLQAHFKQGIKGKVAVPSIATGLQKDVVNKQMNSQRCVKAAETEMTAYMPYFAEAQSDLYNKDSNPNGSILMCVAENRLMGDELEVKYRQVLSDLAADDHFPRHELFDYGLFDSTGSRELKKAVSQVISTHLASPEVFAEAIRRSKDGSGLLQLPLYEPVTADDLVVVTNGCGPALNMISFCLGDDNGKDCFLATSPGYPVFAQDCGLEAGVKVVSSVETKAAEGFKIKVPALEKAYQDCMSEGLNPKALITTDPGNPTGSVSEVDELRAVRNFCAQKGLWWISDEIYGCGVHSDSSKPHISAFNLPLLPGDMDPPTLVLWGFSKDMCLSGMRLGFTLTLPRQREWKSVHTLKLADAKQFGMFAWVSPIAQVVSARLLEDSNWLSWYLKESSNRLTRCKRILCDGLEGLDIPYFEPQAGLFLWADFNEFVKCSSSDSDGLNLFHKLGSSPYNLVVTPGNSFFADRPGMVRMCYAWMQDGENACKEVVKRLEKFVKNARKST